MPFEPYYKDESVTIYNEDCRKVLPWLPKFDLLLTDPPVRDWSRQEEGAQVDKRQPRVGRY
jgi:hypothetical protein